MYAKCRNKLMFCSVLLLQQQQQQQQQHNVALYGHKARTSVYESCLEIVRHHMLFVDT